MHPAPSLAEAPPKTDEPRQTPTQLPRQASPASAAHSRRSLSHGSPLGDSHGSQTPSASPPLRKDTTSSTGTVATNASLATVTSNETAGTTCSLDSSPNFSSQPVFSIKDGADMSNNRRASRRRTGPLSAEQREKAALIRKLGACIDCRRRRVACHPSHHNMTWEDAVRKHGQHSPGSGQELPPLGARPLSPRPLSPASISNGKPSGAPLFTHDPQEMEIDSPPDTPSHPPGSLGPTQGRQPTLSETRIRTPLPSGPRLERIAAQASQAAQAAQAAQAHAQAQALPGIDSLQSEIQAIASRIASNPHRSRYSAVHVRLYHWEGDEDKDVAAVRELAEVLEKQYQYVYEIKPIPLSSESCRSLWMWLSKDVTAFAEHRDQRDVLKIVYYLGDSYLDGDREMVLAFARDRIKSPTIRWSGIQQILEEAVSDTLIIMDAAYYASSKLVRRQGGVLEVVAAAASEDHAGYLDRTSFTRAVAETLRMRATQKFLNPLTAAELHAKVLSSYPKLIQERHPEQEALSSFPSPLHIQISANSRLPSIQLAPIRRALPFGIEADPSGPQMTLTLRLSDDSLNVESWTEWLRLMPEGIKDLKIEGPYRNTFR